MNLPSKLFHGSAFNTKILKPGIKYAKKLITWDGTESNEFLYASIDKEEAIAMSFASLLEKRLQIDKFQVDEDTIIITSSVEINQSAFKETKLYLYTIKTSEDQKWFKVNNKHNGSDDEYKTKEDIQSGCFDKEVIILSEWLKDKKVIFSVKKELLSMQL